MKRLVLAPVVLLTALALLGCGCSHEKLPALGPSNLLTIVTNLRPDDPAIQAVKAAFTRPVVSVEEENRYSFEVHGAAGLARQRDSRNLVLVADLSRRDEVSRKVREVLGRHRAAGLLKRLAARGIAAARVIGRIAETSEGAIRVGLRPEGR